MKILLVDDAPYVNIEDFQKRLKKESEKFEFIPTLVETCSNEKYFTADEIIQFTCDKIIKAIDSQNPDYIFIDMLLRDDNEKWDCSIQNNICFDIANKIIEAKADYKEKIYFITQMSVSQTLIDDTKQLGNGAKIIFKPGSVEEDAEQNPCPRTCGSEPCESRPCVRKDCFIKTLMSL